MKDLDHVIGDGKAAAHLLCDQKLWCKLGRGYRQLESYRAARIVRFSECE